MEYKVIAPRRDGTSLLSQILYNRGFQSLEQITHYLSVDEDDLLDPMLLDNMKQGAQMLIKHISRNSNTLIVVDSDCDGYTSSAILMNYLNRFFPAWVQNNVYYFIHSGKQHGLEDTLRQSDWLVKNIKFIICPDSASNDYAEHKKLVEHGVDCLILDHHETDGGYSMDAVVINNQLSKHYETKSLCGAAVVWKFCCYLDSIMKTQYAIEYEDLAALGLIGDMMNMMDYETHYIIKDGLQRIKNPFFVEMMNKQQRQFEGGITPIGVAFYIVPYINAMSRSGTMEEKYLMFEAMLEWRSNEMIPSTKRGCKGQIETRYEQAVRTCVNVKSRQKRAQDSSLANIEARIEKEKLLDNKLLILRVPEEEVDKNLAGLIANQLANKYARPTLVLRVCTDEDGNITYSGSGRNYTNSKLENFRQFCLDTGCMELAQGHASAFGASIKEEYFDDFVNITNQQLADFDFSPCYYVDLEVTADQLSDSEVFAIGSNADLWGQGLEEPLIAITNIVINKDSIQYMGQHKDTLKLTFPGRKTCMIQFHVKEEDKIMLDPGEGTLTLTAVGKCALNHYMGNVTPQVLLEDFEINRRNKWDF